MPHCREYFRRTLRDSRARSIACSTECPNANQAEGDRLTVFRLGSLQELPGCAEFICNMQRATCVKTNGKKATYNATWALS
jgi:hypothetical protein